MAPVVTPTINGGRGDGERSTLLVGQVPGSAGTNGTPRSGDGIAIGDYEEAQRRFSDLVVCAWDIIPKLMVMVDHASEYTEELNQRQMLAALGEYNRMLTERIDAVPECPARGILKAAKVNGKSVYSTLRGWKRHVSRISGDGRYPFCGSADEAASEIRAVAVDCLRCAQQIDWICRAIRVGHTMGKEAAQC